MKEIVLTPTYMSSFNCIGSECEDSCCIGWKVTLDKKSYQKYKNIRHAEVGGELRNGLKRIKNGAASELQYGYFKMDNKGRCPMLDTNNLCSIQLNLGEDHLSPVCSTYPRMFNKINNEYELSAKLSCPEVARLALLNPNGIDFEKKEIEVSSTWSSYKNLKLESKAIEESHFWKIREFCIDIVQNRNLEVSDRLIFLGLFINKLQELLYSRKYVLIDELIKEYQIKINNRDYLVSISNINDSISLQIEALLKLIVVRKKAGVSNPRYVECLNDMIRGLNIEGEEEIKIEDLENRYIYNYKNYYLPFFNEHGYIMENYIVNYMFERMFPDLTGNVFGEYTKMATLFAILKVHLVGISGYYKELNTSIVLKTIQSFVRSIEHNEYYLKGMMEILNENKFTSLAHIASLLKDRKIK